MTDAMAWDLADFAFAGALVLGVGLTYELAAWATGDIRYRAAVAVGLAAAVLLVWLSTAVGMIGSEDNPANLMYGGVLAVGVVGAIAARFQRIGMARTLAAMALVQLSITGFALFTGIGTPESGPLEILLLNGFFAALWLTSALLFSNAAATAP